ncbi:MAG TPA: hypothetical protein VEY12_09645 [Thermoplasmata archaeon]|nr:hypothetical protein [Thermoplasmata archaeon]
MVVPLFRESRLLRAAVLTTWAASLMAWIYVVLRIVLNGINPPDPFLPGVRGLSFVGAGAISFGLFCVSMFLYLWLWGRFGGTPPMPGSPYGRGPWGP